MPHSFFRGGPVAPPPFFFIFFQGCSQALPLPSVLCFFLVGGGPGSAPFLYVLLGNGLALPLPSVLCFVLSGGAWQFTPPSFLLSFLLYYFIFLFMQFFFLGCPGYTPSFLSGGCGSLPPFCLGSWLLSPTFLSFWGGYLALSFAFPLFLGGAD